MAQITMDSTEYLELIDKARMLDKIEQEMVANVEITLDPDGTFRKFSPRIIPAFTDNAVKQIIRKVVDALISEDYVMDDLVPEGAHFLNLSTGWVSYSWNNTPAEGEVDLLKDKAFKEAWDAAVTRRADKSVEAEEEE